MLPLSIAKYVWQCMFVWQCIFVLLFMHVCMAMYVFMHVNLGFFCLSQTGLVNFLTHIQCWFLLYYRKEMGYFNKISTSVTKPGEKH